MIRIELDPPKQSAPCPCCGGKTTSLTRFVYKDDDAYAIYYAKFSDNHPERIVTASVSIGEWDDDATPDQRIAFAVKLRATESEYEVSVVDAASSPWNDVAFIGRTLDRDEALAHPRINEIFHITDHMVVDDAPLVAYLNGQSADA